MFDLGLGNGLRNKLSEAIVKKNIIEAKNYISTAYTSIFLISIVIGIIGIEIILNINWSSVFNTDTIEEISLRNTVLIAVIFCVLNFTLSLINQIFNALQKIEFTVCNQFVFNFICLIGLYGLNVFSSGNIKYVAFCYGLSLFTVTFLFSIFFFHKNRVLLPKIKFFRKEFISKLFSLGTKFFVIQIAVIILFTTDRMVITQLLGPEYVTPYDVVFKLFSIATIAHSIIISPLWTSYSDAYHSGDMNWIKRMMNNQIKIFVYAILLCITLSLLTPFIIKVWIGKLALYDNKLVIFICIFTLIQIWNNIFAMFLNGINETKVQTRTAIFSAILNIPLSIMFVKVFNMGIDGVILGSILALSIFSFFGPYISYKKIYR